MTVTKVVRKARKARRCDGCDRAGKIQPGDAYLTHTALRGDEFGYGDFGHNGRKTRPQRSAECAECAYRYGRGPLLDPVLEGQTSIEDVIEGGGHGMHEEALPI